MKRSMYLLVCLLIIGIQATIAQNRTISGHVSSQEDEMGLAGVSVSVRGTTTGTITDANGDYSIAVEDGADALVFSFVGMTTREISLGSATRIDVVMQSADINLDEVVVTALGISREKKALRKFESLLLEDDFTRVHNSHVINMNHIRKFVRKDGLMVRMTDNCMVPIAVRRKPVFEEKLKLVAI